MYAAPLTELEAVNDMLAVIGQAPVNAFTANNSDQNIARQELAKVVREVCAYGFKFNTDEGHTLLPEIDGTIAIAGKPTPSIRASFKARSPRAAGPFGVASERINEPQNQCHLRRRERPARV